MLTMIKFSVIKQKGYIARFLSHFLTIVLLAQIVLVDYSQMATTTVQQGVPLLFLHPPDTPQNYTFVVYPTMFQNPELRGDPGHTWLYSVNPYGCKNYFGVDACSLCSKFSPIAAGLVGMSLWGAAIALVLLLTEGFQSKGILLTFVQLTLRVAIFIGLITSMLIFWFGCATFLRYGTTFEIQLSTLYWGQIVTVTVCQFIGLLATWMDARKISRKEPKTLPVYSAIQEEEEVLIPAKQNESDKILKMMSRISGIVMVLIGIYIVLDSFENMLGEMLLINNMQYSDDDGDEEDIVDFIALPSSYTFYLLKVLFGLVCVTCGLCLPHIQT
eukprot:m.302037 g.302037  ORF g.302037 m.302037 type:complete len:329 (+) comp16432_c0_seq11:108-1094(+)